MEGTIINKELEINDRIRDREVRVIDDNGEQLGVISSIEANRIADEKNLDLVKINPNTTPPVCKIMNYGKYKFDLAKKEKDSKKNQKVSELKEVWLSMTIDDHDLDTKAKMAERFLKSGDKVKVSIKMRGRQQAHSSIGVDVMNKFFATLEPIATLEKRPLTEGRNIIMILSQKKL